MNRTSGPCAIIVFAMGLITGTGSVAGQAPSTIPVQGFLTDADGAPIDGEHRLTFTLYDAEADGNVLFTDDSTRTLTAGHFTAYLGSGDTALDLALFQTHGDVWLETIVDGTDIIQPRTPLGSVPYAASADYAAFCGSVDWASLQSVPADIADGDQGFTTEAQLSSLLDDNYVSAAGGTAADLTTTGTLTTGNVRVNSTEDVNAGAAGAVVIGPTSGDNVGIDGNEIMARNNGAVSTLYLNSQGGDVQIGRSRSTAADLTVLEIDVDTAERASGTDSVPEVYSLTGSAGCRRGSMFVGRPSGAPNQDALCVCLDNAGTATYWCFNP